MKFLTIYPNIRDDTFLHASEFFSNDSSTDRRRDISIHSNVQSLTQVLQKRSVCRYKTFHTIKTSFLHLSIPLYSLFHVSDLFDPLATVLLRLLLLSLSLSLTLSLSLSLSLSQSETSQYRSTTLGDCQPKFMLSQIFQNRLVRYSSIDEMVAGQIYIKL